MSEELRNLNLEELRNRGYELCPHCQYIWPPRVKNPKDCPKCKRPLALTEEQLARKAMKRRREQISMDITVLRKEQQIHDNKILLCEVKEIGVASHPAQYCIEDERGKKHLYCKDHCLNAILNDAHKDLPPEIETTIHGPPEGYEESSEDLVVRPRNHQV